LTRYFFVSAVELEKGREMNGAWTQITKYKNN